MHNLSAKIQSISQLFQSLFEDRLDGLGNCEKYQLLPKLSDIEIVAMSILMEFEGIHSENHLYYILKTQYPFFFASCPHRSNFNRRRRRLHLLIDECAALLSELITIDSTAYLIDSTPIPVCRFARANRLKIMRENSSFCPTIGYSAIDRNRLKGYRLHVVCDENGVIVNYVVAQAHEHDINFLQPLSETLPSGSEVIGDKGYIDEGRQLELFNDNQVKVYTAARNNQKATPFPITKRKQRIRKRIETCFSQLKDQFNLAANYAKSQVGLLTRIISKIAAFTYAQYLNSKAGLPIGMIKNTTLN